MEQHDAPTFIFTGLPARTGAGELAGVWQGKLESNEITTCFNLPRKLRTKLFKDVVMDDADQKWRIIPTGLRECICSSRHDDVTYRQQHLTYDARA